MNGNIRQTCLDISVLVPLYKSHQTLFSLLYLDISKHSLQQSLCPNLKKMLARNYLKMFCQYHPNRCGQKIVLSRNSLQKSQKRTF